MQTPTILRKINPKLTGSRREIVTYSEKHKNRNKKIKGNYFSLAHLEDSFITRISARGQRIIEIMNSGGDSQTIRIQQEIKDYEMMKREFSETEDLWNTQINQTKNELNELKENIKLQQKLMKDMEKQLSIRRSKIINLEDRYKKVEQEQLGIPTQNFEKEIELLSEQYQKIEQMGKTQLKLAEAEHSELREEKEELDEELEQLKQEKYNLESFQMDNFNSKLSELLEEESQFKEDISRFEVETETAKRNMQSLQMARPIKEELHRKYLQLYEKIFINKELDAIESLIEYKDEEINRLQQYGNRKVLYRGRRKEIQDIEVRILSKKNSLTSLEHEIRDKSTVLLNLYQMESQKMK